MQVDNTIRVGQLVRIKSSTTGDAPNTLYLVIGKHGDNCELLAVQESKSSNVRRWWNAQGLSGWV